MPGWGWFLIGLLTALLVAGAVAFLFWRLTQTPLFLPDRAALDALNERRRLADDAAAASVQKAAAESTIRLDAELKALAEKVAARMEEIDAEAKKKALDLAGDPAALVDHVNEILAGGPFKDGPPPPKDLVGK